MVDVASPLEDDAAAVVRMWATSQVDPGLEPLCRVSSIIQRLWSGYGVLCRVGIDVTPAATSEPPAVRDQGTSSSSSSLPLSVVCKAILLPALTAGAPSSAAAAVGDRRKRRSYEVEAYWYEHVRPRLSAAFGEGHELPMPRPLSVDVATTTKRISDTSGSVGRPSYIVMSDLVVDGFSDARPDPSDESALRAALEWLAALHSRFLGATTSEELDALIGSGVEGEPTTEATRPGLWPQAQYWNLATRHQEFELLPCDSFLARAAHHLDARLRAAPQTVCHGDAKLPNFMFTPPLDRTLGEGNNTMQRTAAAVDFQYAGKGCGMCDVAYLLHSTVGKAFFSVSPALATQPSSNDDQEVYAAWRTTVEPWLQWYISALEKGLMRRGVKRECITDLCRSYREVFDAAVLDYWRFYMGWAPAMRTEEHHVAQASEYLPSKAPGYVRVLCLKYAAELSATPSIEEEAGAQVRREYV